MNQTTARKGKMRAFFRRCVFTAVMCCLLVAATVVATSADAVFPPDAVTTKVYVDGKEVLSGDCIILNSTTYVPLRKFCNLFADCNFSWDGKSSSAIVKSEELTMTVQSNAAYITANGHVYYTVEKVRNLGGHLYVPIRPLAKAFDTELTWNAQARAVEISTQNRDREAVAWANYRSDEVYWLSRIISAEAGGESLEGQIAVGNVVLNRVRHSSYPNTIYGVIFDRKHGTQFSPVSYGTIYNPPTESAIRAAKICLEGYTLSDSILFFMNPRIATNNWISKNRPYAFTIGNHDFYY